MKNIKIVLAATFLGLLIGCANNPIVGIESGEKGVYFKRLSIRCVAGKSPVIDLDSVSLSQEQVQPGSVLTHIVTVERCTKDDEPAVSGPPVKVTRQIMVGADAVATSSEDISAQINRNGLWDVKSQINIGNNPPGRYAIKTTVDAGGRKLVRVIPFAIVR